MDSYAKRRLLIALSAACAVWIAGEALLACSVWKSAQANPLLVAKAKFRVCKTIAYIVDPVGTKRDDDRTEFLDHCYAQVTSDIRRKDFAKAADHYKHMLDNVKDWQTVPEHAFHLNAYASLLRRANRADEAKESELAAVELLKHVSLAVQPATTDGAH